MYTYIRIDTPIKAKMVDEDKLHDILAAGLKESPWGRWPVNNAFIRMMINVFFNHIDANRCVFVCAVGNKPVGLIAATIDSNPAVGTRTAQELVWYVDPAHRRSNIATELIDLYEDWAREKKCTLCSLCHYMNETGDVCAKLYLKKGYAPIELNYIKELE